MTAIATNEQRFVDPVDDIRPSNPSTMPALFDKVAADFATDFDVSPK